MAQKRTYEVPESLVPAIAVADKYGVLVTSTTGGGHNKGSKHYIGEAFDIDHKKLNANPKLKQAFFGDLQNLGFGYIDETTRPKGQAVWGGPHYHIQKGLGQQTQRPVMAPVIGKPQKVTLPNFPEPVPYTDPIGSWEELQQRLNQGGGLYRPDAQQKQEKAFQQYQKSFDKAAQQTVEIKPIKTKYKQVDSTFDPNAFLDKIRSEYPDIPAPQPVPLNPLEQFGAGLNAPFTGYAPSTDITAQQEGGSLPYQAGNFLGQVGINVGGAGLGLLGGPVGSAIGGFAAGGALGARQEAQRQRLAGEQENLGKQFGSGALQGGLNLIPAVGTGLKLLPRLGINAALQGVGGALGDVTQQAIEQGTIAPQVDVRRTLGAAGLGAAGGAAGGLMSRGKPRPITVGGQRRPVQVGGQMVGADGNAARQRVVFGGMDVIPAPEPVRSTLDPTNPASYGLPETPKVKPVEYSQMVQPKLPEVEPKFRPFVEGSPKPRVNSITPQFSSDLDNALYTIGKGDIQSKGHQKMIDFVSENTGLNEDVIQALAVKVRQDVIDSVKSGEPNIAVSWRNRLNELLPKEIPNGPKGTDAALYDVANSTPETNPAAWAAAREGLQEYGDLNIQDVGKKVGEVVDALPQGEVIPENITERLVAPKAKDPIANASPRPQTPAEIVATSRKLAGTVDEMIAQGTEASPIKTREQYNNLTKAYKELYGGIGRYNKDVKNGLIDLSDLTPEVMAQRGGMLNDMINTGAIIPQARVISPRVLRDFQVKYQQMLDGAMNEGQLAKMQATIADMEYRAQLQNLSDQMDTIHPEVRKAWEFDYDPQTKLAMQKEGADAEAVGGRKLQRFEDIMEGLPETLYNRTMMIKDATQNGASLRIDADTEITGATSRVSQREVTPIGGFRTKDGHIGFTAYNDDGHLANYYITPKANPDTGMISQVKSVEILGSEKFRGEYANVYLGPREFRVDDILKRPPRMEGVTTSQARQTLRKAAGVFNNPELQALNPRVKDLMDQISKNPDRMTIEDVKNIEDLLTADRKVLKAACEILGRL